MVIRVARLEKNSKCRPRTKKNDGILGDIKKNYELYLFVIPAVLVMLVFHYFPIYGVQIAFKNFSPGLGILKSPWCGFDNFKEFFNSYQFTDILWNTISLSMYELFVGFPFPILLALMLNLLRQQRYKKVIQMVTYAPHFISTVVMVSMITLFLDPQVGIINKIIAALGAEPISFMSSTKWYKTVYVFSGIWQGCGWSSIIYFASLSSVSPDLHEAAIVDGASRLDRIWHVDIPCILPTIVIMLILRSGQILNIGFEKSYLMQNSLNLPVSNVISTYVYQTGLRQSRYDYSTAVGLFNSVVNIILLLTVNKISKAVGETSLW